MQFPITGAAYTHQYQDVNYQRCINMFPTDPGEDGQGKLPLIDVAGLKLLTDLLVGPIRGMHVFKNKLYVVAGQNFYEITVNTDARTLDEALLRGVLNTTDGYVSIDNNPTQIIVVDGSPTGYIYTPVDVTFDLIDATDNFYGGGQVLFHDSYFVYIERNSQRFFTSDNNDGKSWDAIDVASAENKPDNLVAINTTKGELWLFGNESIEVWYNNANPAGSPYSSRNGTAIAVGVAAPFSVTVVDNVLMWLDSRGFVVQSNVSAFIRDNSSGYDLKIISTDAINNAISTYERIDDAVGCYYNDRGHLMYELSFPTALKTWVYDSTTKLWHEKSWYNDYYGRFEHSLTQFTVQLGPLVLAGGVRDGKVYVLDSNYSTFDEDPMHRLRSTAFLADEHKEISINKLELRVQVKYPAEEAVGQDPLIGLRYSHDGGHTWSSEIIRQIGKVGEYNKRVIWNRLGSGREWIFEVSMTEPVSFCLIAASVDMTFEE